GSGYSSLNLLKDFHFDELKIDMAFLSDFHARSRMILASIVDMAKRIGTHTLTEGVETEEKFEFLRNIGCEKVQGSLFGTPMPYQDCLAHARARELEWEPPVLFSYYEDLGRVNFLSPTPFRNNVTPTDGREMNGIPLALLEIRGDEVRCLFTNRAFDAVAATVDFRLMFGEDGRRMAPDASLGMEKLSDQLRGLLEETRGEAGKGTLHLVFHGEYYVLQARRMSCHDEFCAVLLRMENLSRGAELYRQKALDEGLRQIYSIYNWVTVLNLENGTMTPLYLDSREQAVPLTGELHSILARYAVRWVFPGDRERFLSFSDPDTLSQRIQDSRAGSLTVNLRTRTYHGSYLWKSYSLIRVRENIYYLLVRDAETEIRELLQSERADALAEELSPEALWFSAVQYFPIKFFWKDRDRRFRGASQSFLDFYGFHSLADILGKTDEDMGWHIHPDNYRDVEWDVIHEGMISYNRLGTCIVRGESHNIMASKIPVYDHFGDIIGLFGYFVDEHFEPEAAGASFRSARRDALTGLLNTRGLDEDVFAYLDEYELRHTDFFRIDAAIEGLPEINRNYGFDFGDSVIRAVADQLLSRCGISGTIGRLTGSQFTIYRQMDGQTDPQTLAAGIRAISTELKEIDGVPFTTYLSVGYSIYSEAGSLENQAAQSQIRRLTDDLGNTSRQQWKHDASRIFFMYETLPMGYAVYRLMGSEERPDLLTLYANGKFASIVGRTTSELIGESIREVLPFADERMYRIAWDAAVQGKGFSGQIKSARLQKKIAVTAAQIIGPGYCGVTYQILEEETRPLSGAALTPARGNMT
ncbi:MAG: EAL domain-containing protein, partial [Oscillospiraceae bacterium]|nr:EAL domain-containing protein [Oscillospiraceae bacterium]